MRRRQLCPGATKGIQGAAPQGDPPGPGMSAPSQEGIGMAGGDLRQGVPYVESTNTA